MADPENPPVPNEGILARLAEKFGIKSEATIVAELKAENTALLATANEVQAELDGVKATLATSQSTVSALTAKVTALESVVPGITSSATPAEALQAHITMASANAIAAMGMEPGTAPAVTPNAGNDTKSIPRAEYDKLSPRAQADHCKSGGKVSE